MVTTSLSLETLAEHYRLFNRTENKSPRTVEWYDDSLSCLIDWLREEGRSTLLQDVDVNTVRAFILYQQERKVKYARRSIGGPEEAPLSSHTIQARVRAIRAFFHWLKREGYTSTHLLEDLRVPKVQQNVVEILTEEEIKSILSYLNPNTATGARGYAIIWTLLDTGLRCSELTTLKLSDAHVQDGYLRVLGKGNKERVVPIGLNTQRLLLRYRDHFRQTPQSESVDTFFLSQDGLPLTPNSVQLILHRLGEKAGVPRIHPHLLRHTFATRYLMSGGDVFTLQRILGHTTLAMVNHYVQLAASHVAIQHRKYSPMDAMGLRPYRRGLSIGQAEGRSDGQQSPKANGKADVKAMRVAG